LIATGACSREEPQPKFFPAVFHAVLGQLLGIRGHHVTRRDDPVRVDVGPELVRLPLQHLSPRSVETLPVRAITPR
jgi:hypothetical protein